jgi:hypothetical protein
MAQDRSKKGSDRTTLKLSTEARPDFDEPLAAFVFDGRGNLIERVEVEGDTLELEMSPARAARARVLLVPAEAEISREESPPSPARLQALGAYEPGLRAPEGGGVVERIRIPGSVLDRWPFCFCLVRGRVIRRSDSRPVCDARVTICEVDRIPRWIRELPDPDLFRLREELLNPVPRPLPEPIPTPPDPVPDPVPGPRPPGPDPVPLGRPLLRLPRTRVDAPSRVPLEAGGIDPLPPILRSQLRLISSPESLRQLLLEHWRILPPYLCLWPWIWRFRCDEVAVVHTDANGRFQALVPYVCGGDRPDLYFRVEYDFGSGWETVYAPPVPCATRWDHDCSSTVVLRVSDPRVPACNDEPDLNGKQVWVISVGRNVSIGEILRAPAGSDEGTVEEAFGPSASGTERFAFGGRLEPRVWFGRTALAADGIEHYLWSVRPLGGSESDWEPLDRQVIRHYTTPGGTAPVEVMGPVPGGANEGRFKIRPADPPAGGIEWIVVDEREDLASGHLVTTAPPVPDAPGPCGVADPRAGKVELKLELFDGSGNRVDWDARGITLRVATNEAPFGTDPVLTEVATEYHRIRDGGATVAFRMVLHLDNSRCGGEIQPVAGSGIAVDPDCGVVTLTGSSPTLDVAFSAGRPGGRAHLSFATQRGLSTPVPAASASGRVGAPAGGFSHGPPCSYTRTGLSTATFLGTCPQGAFAQTLRVRALTVNGYSRLSGLDATDVAAFMLSEPCPGAAAPGAGGGRGSAGRGGPGAGPGAGE